MFIDDDEIASPKWLRDLIAVHQKTGAAAVVGLVITKYARPPERGIVTAASLTGAA